MEQLLGGLLIVLQPTNIMFLIIGAVIGLLMGILPGVGSVLAIALLIPFTFGMDPSTGILTMVALYVTAVYGGSITAILFGIPGEAPAVATTFDGYTLTKKGKAGLALGTAIFSSFIGGTFSAITLILIAPWLSSVGLRFGDPEFFAMSVLGLSICAGIGQGTVIKNIISALIGIFLATWGIDTIQGQERFTFGTSALQMGITFIPATIGLFAIGEVFDNLGTYLKDEKRRKAAGQTKQIVKVQMPSLKEIYRMKWLYLRSAILGNILGILPGVGATLAAFFGYSEAVRWSKEPEKFGTGIIDGIAAPETANNAGCGGALVPLLTLGIPGSAATAVMIGAFIIHGIRPGPMLIFSQPSFFYAIIMGYFVSNFIVFLAGYVGVKAMVKVLEVSYSKVAPAILLLSLVGSFSLRNNMFDVWIAFGFGILSFFMRRYKYGLAPMILGIILGPICEESLRNAMVISGGDPLCLIKSPLSASMLALAILSIFYPYIRSLIFKKK